MTIEEEHALSDRISLVRCKKCKGLCRVAFSIVTKRDKLHHFATCPQCNNGKTVQHDGNLSRALVVPHASMLIVKGAKTLTGRRAS